MRLSHLISAVLLTANLGAQAVPVGVGGRYVLHFKSRPIPLEATLGEGAGSVNTQRAQRGLIVHVREVRGNWAWCQVYEGPKDRPIAKVWINLALCEMVEDAFKEGPR